MFSTLLVVKMKTSVVMTIIIIAMVRRIVIMTNFHDYQKIWIKNTPHC